MDPCCGQKRQELDAVAVHDAQRWEGFKLLDAGSPLSRELQELAVVQR